MSPSAQQRSGGFSALLAHAGETLTRQDTPSAVSVKAIVNRRVVKMRDGLATRDGRIDFSVMGVTEVEILLSKLATVEAGDVLEDLFGFSHRVKMVCTTDITWVLYCERFETQ